MTPFGACDFLFNSLSLSLSLKVSVFAKHVDFAISDKGWGTQTIYSKVELMPFLKRLWTHRGAVGSCPYLLDEFDFRKELIRE